ncbi:MAG: hypothetical protein GXO83_03140 [Chlorobi bacterium]|nr:hypothetical protein [Chlorobiota bacterium]
MEINKYSFGTGDRFGHQGVAQLQAIMKTGELGIDLVPVWNKSHREHTIIGTTPGSVREEAGNAVKKLGWDKPWFVDADHINKNNVDAFIEPSDFFTIDIADFIGKKPDTSEVSDFIKRNRKYTGTLNIPGIEEKFHLSGRDLERIAGKFLFACREAAGIYNYIADRKGAGNFVTEVSMDEVDAPQNPVELFFILSALAGYGVPVQTIAPKFTGRFNKGVDYEGDVGTFSREFEQDLLAIEYAIHEFGLPRNLKLSVHSGSDKFAIYPVMGSLIKKYDKGIHIKTAGTTWLEEVTGLALAGGDGLMLAKEIYRKALEKQEDLCAPYASVIGIDPARLPPAEEVNNWDGGTFAAVLRHDREEPRYNPDFRQLIHVGYKIAAEMGEKYTSLLEKYSGIIGQQVFENIYDRHIRRLFGV